MSELLLDTCGLIWLAQGGGGLSREALDAIDKADFVHVSTITAWEVSLLETRGQIELPFDAEEWFSALITSKGIHVIGLDLEIVFLANKLPWHHRDPSDRFIIATAMVHQLAIVTTDKNFRAYDVPLVS